MISTPRRSLASKVRVLAWSAWAPGVSQREEWLEFFDGRRSLTEDASPDVSAISPLLRRRMSRLTRMSISVALDCCRKATIPPSDVRAVFASRHGEMGTTLELLQQMTAKEPLSPMSFSGSVHHTSLGYFSIAASNQRTMRAVGGGEASFAYGFLVALGMLNEDKQSPVLLVTTDDLLAAPFGALVKHNSTPYAVAFLLGSAGPVNKGNLSLKTGPIEKTAAQRKSVGIPPLDFLFWILSGKTSLEMNLSGRRWRWEK